MNAPSLGFCRTSLALSSLLVGWPALAQPSPTEPTEANTTVPQGSAEAPTVVAPPVTQTNAHADDAVDGLGPVFVEVVNDGFAVSPGAVSSAIARELGVALTSNAATARGTFTVHLTRGKEVTVTFRDAAGDALERVVKAPENDEQVIEVVTLLAVNLSKDKSREVLTGLSREKRPLDAAPPPPSVASLPAASSEPSAPTAEALPYAWGNATFVAPLSILRDVQRRTVGFELGLLYSDIGSSGGVALNPLVIRVRHSSQGVLIAGVGTVSGADGHNPADQGARISGAFNYARAPLDGLSMAGAVDVLAQADEHGKSLDGSQLSGAANVAMGSVEGLQMAGALNYAAATTGAQIGGAVNIAQGTLQGAQLSGAVNVAGDVEGAQIGLVNIGKRVSGAQIGVVNIAEEVDGASIGLVTYSKRGKTHVSAWFDSTRPVNLGVRFVSGVLYAMPMLGGNPTKTEEFDYGFSFGARIPVDRVYFDIEGNSSQHFADGKVDESAVDLRYRAAVGLRVLPYLGVFAGGGVRHRFHAKDGGEHEVGGLWNVGLDLF